MKKTVQSRSHRRLYPTLFDNNLHLFDKTKNNYTEAHMQHKKKPTTTHDQQTKFDMTSFQRYCNMRPRSTNQLESDNLIVRVLKNSESPYPTRNVSPLRFKESRDEPLMQRKRSISYKEQKVKDLMNDFPPHKDQELRSNPSRSTFLEQTIETPKFQKLGLKTDYFIAHRNPITAGVDYRDLNNALSPVSCGRALPRYAQQEQLFFKNGFEIFTQPASPKLSHKNVMHLTSKVKELINQENVAPAPRRTRDLRDFRGDQITDILNHTALQTAPKQKDNRDFRGSEITRLINGEFQPQSTTYNDQPLVNDHLSARYLKRNNSQNIKTLMEGDVSPRFY